VDKLLFIQINTRVFARKAKIRHGNSRDDSNDDNEDDSEDSDDEIDIAMQETPYFRADTPIETNGQGMDP